VKISCEHALFSSLVLGDTYDTTWHRSRQPDFQNTGIVGISILPTTI